MARLILLNGAPGVGKSTLARRYAADHPLLLVLDLDVVRGLLGDDGPDVTASWLAARELGVAMADVHLRAGHDVIVPQYLGRPEFVERLAATAAATGAEFVEVALLTDRRVGEQRFDDRGDVPQLVGSRETYGEMHARLAQLLTTRPHVAVVDATAGVDATYRALCAALSVTSGVEGPAVG